MSKTNENEGSYIWAAAQASREFAERVLADKRGLFERAYSDLCQTDGGSRLAFQWASLGAVFSRNPAERRQAKEWLAKNFGVTSPDVIRQQAKSVSTKIWGPKRGAKNRKKSGGEPRH